MRNELIILDIFKHHLNAMHMIWYHIQNVLDNSYLIALMNEL